VPVHAEYARGGGDVAAVFAKHFLEKTLAGTFVAATGRRRRCKFNSFASHLPGCGKLPRGNVSHSAHPTARLALRLLI
jgi:hypothetical protein